VIGSLRGTVLARSTNGEALVEVAGIGYRVQVTARTLGELEPTSAVFLYVHHHIREDAQTLYGFLTRDERDAFEVLLGAHGVGPALALAILSVHAPGALRDVVASADLAALCLVPGVGKKTAERLLVELRSRLAVPDIDIVAALNGSGGPSPLVDVRDALANLGYAPDEIREALHEVPTGDDASALLRDALKVLGARHA
jgi:holliday junction DNA helicase RuvA